MAKIKITDLKPDSRNFNKHTQKGMGLLEKSMQKFGFVEAGLISEDNVICSGNARQETAVMIGMEEVQIVEIDGTKPVYLKKKGLQSDTKEFHELALALNQTAKENIVFDAEVIEATLEEAVIEEWGVSTDKHDSTDYSEKNKEIDVDEFDEKMEFKLKLSSDEFFDLQERLSIVKAKQNVDTNEQAIFELLNIYEARS